MRTLLVFTSTASVALAVAILFAASVPEYAAAVTLTQAEAPIPVQTMAPNPGGADGIPDLDTKEPTEAATTNNIVLLIAALGVLVGVLIVTRRKSGPDS